MVYVDDEAQCLFLLLKPGKLVF